MGFLRALLAMMVVFSHRGQIGQAGYVLQGGAVFAVKAFFMVSGFYMSLVIHDRYHKLPVTDFYASRLLRLLPVYWVIGALTFAAEFFLVPSDRMFYSQVSPLWYWAGPNGLNFQGIPAAVWAYVAVTDVTLLGADSWLWLGFSRVDGALSLAPGYGPSATSGNALSPVPQAWSIGCELWFYLIAPFIVRRLWLVLALAAASLLIRAFMETHGFSGEPWNRAFFPSELIYFLLGVLAHHVYLRFPDFRFPERHRQMLVAGALAGAFLIGPLGQLARHSRLIEAFLTFAPYLFLFAVLPCLFGATKDSRIDSAVGELSYPLYMCHLLVYGLLAAVPVDFQAFVGKTWGSALFNAGLVIVLAFAVERSIVLPMDRYRRRFGARVAESPGQALPRRTAPSPVR